MIPKSIVHAIRQPAKHLFRCIPIALPSSHLGEAAKFAIHYTLAVRHVPTTN